MSLSTQLKTDERRKPSINESITSGPPPAQPPNTWDDLYGRSTARSQAKKAKDLLHWQIRQERTRAYNTAYRDVVNSHGEIIITETLRLVDCGDVLRDPKLRPSYEHPKLQVK